MQFSLREIGRIFPLSYEILRLEKRLNYLILGFQRGNVFKL